MEIVDRQTIGLSREMNDLDVFVQKFVNILSIHARYAIVSGYVAILFGRSRGTEGVDIVIARTK